MGGLGGGGGVGVGGGGGCGRGGGGGGWGLFDGGGRGWGGGGGGWGGGRRMGRVLAGPIGALDSRYSPPWPPRPNVDGPELAALRARALGVRGGGGHSWGCRAPLHHGPPSSGRRTLQGVGGANPGPLYTLLGGSNSEHTNKQLQLLLVLPG